MNDTAKSPSPHRLAGAEHWTTKDGNVKLFLWNKCEAEPAHTKGTILFVHGSSMASQPTFDLDVPGRPDSSVMEHFAYHGYDTWCVDMEGYGRSEKGRDNNAPISFGAEIFASNKGRATRPRSQGGHHAFSRFDRCSRACGGDDDDDRRSRGR